MAFDSYFTDQYRLPYFGRGDIYSARADYERFVTLDRHFESYVGVIGVGVIQGWTIATGSGLTVSVDWGDGFINGYYSESGWVVKKREDVLPTDQVITQDYYTDSTTGQIYDKVFYRQSLTLPDDADSFLYAYRNSNYAITDPYLEPNNGSPVPETSNTLNPSRTAVSFGYATSQQQASSSGRVYIGLVVARRGSIEEVDTSAVKSLANMEAAIKEFGDYVINNHRHGGDGTFDPQPIRLEVDRRTMILSNSTDSRNEFTAQNNEKTTTVEDHSHSYYVNGEGTGITTAITGDVTYHFHEITEFDIGAVKGSSSDITAHVHEINLPPGNDDGWDADDAVQIYVNEEAYEGSNAVVDADAKTVTFTGDVTVKFRKYGIDHGGWIYEGEEKSLYRFMLRACLQYYSDNPNATNIILPSVSTPASVLENQAISGETRLVNQGDTFLFVADAASDVTVTLLQEGHVDKVEIEILTNSEVQGRLPEGNILYIPASKIATGTFEPERIPVLSHLGRFLELSEPRTQRLKSADGRIYDIVSDDIFGNVQIVYSVVDDGGGDYYLSTSNGVYRKPPAGAYYFVVNGEHTATDPGDMRTRLEQAVSAYQRKTGDSIIVDSNTYDEQITAATSALSGYGDYYEFTGERNENAPTGYDQIWVFYVEQYKLTEYGYQANRFAGEIKPDETIIREIPQEVDEDAEEEPLALYLVENDFHKHTAKELLIEQNLVSGYDGSTLNKLYSVSSDQMVTSVNAEREWSILDEAGLSGYIFDFSRSYSGVMAIGKSTGLRVSALSTGRGFRSVAIPYYGAEIRGVEVGFDDVILAAMRGTVAVSSDFGNTWDTNELTTSTIERIFYDSALDQTTVVDSHYHTVTLNARGDGTTSSDNGHEHTVAAGIVGLADGHTHGMIRTYYAIDKVGVVYRSINNGTDWTTFATIPVTYSEWSQPFAAFGSVYVPVYEKMISTTGSSWSDVDGVKFNVYSASRTFDGENMVLGGVNVAYLYDGSTLTSVYSTTGSPVPAMYFDNIQRYFGRYLNNEANTIDMGGDLLLGTAIDAITVFDEYYPEQDGWSDGIEYDLYLNDRILLSTRKNIDRTGTTHVAVNNTSVIDFSVSSLLADSVAIGATSITVADSADFPDTGTVSIGVAKTGNQDFNPTYFFDYYGKSGNKLLLSSPSRYVVTKADGTAVGLMSSLGADDIVRITVYEGKLTNVGINTHADIEDAFSTKDIGLGKRLGDVYLSNIIHLTAATKAVFSTIGDDYRNFFLTMFDYNDIPGDPKNIDRFIDREASDLASLSLYKVEDYGGVSSSLPNMIAGFGSFAGTCFAASNVGLFKMDCSSSLESNWFRVDVDGSERCYGVMQYRSDIIYVATEKGLYVNSDTTLESWTQIDEDAIGGVPTLVVPRWSTLVDEETGIDYWWGDWDGVVHENSALINTIIVSGDGFLSYSDDRGATWLSGQFRDASGSTVDNIVPLSYLLLRNGTMMACTKTSTGIEYGVYIASGTGGIWNEVYTVSSISGTMKSASVTDNLNVVVTVQYAAGTLPADQSLVGREMAIGEGAYRVIANSMNEITLFGEGVMDETATSYQLRPWRFNTVHEDSEKRITIGSSIGTLWDRGGLYAGDRKRDGSIKSLGNKATITSLNISGTISTSFIIPEASVITAELDKKVVRNELVDMTIDFLPNIPDLKVKSNGVTKGDGTVDIIVEGDISEVVNGYRFTARGAGIRLYVDFDGVVEKDDLKGGVLTPQAEGSERGTLRENIGIFTIVGNTDEYIDLAEEYAAPVAYDPYDRLFVDAVVLASNSDGTVPVTVEFDTQRGINELRGNKLNVRGDDGLPDGGEIGISANDEISVVLDETYSASATSVDGSTTSGTYSVFNTLEEGIDFYLSGIPFMPRTSFSDQLSSRHGGHYHGLTMIDGPIEGTVLQFGAITASTVEFVLTGAAGLSNPYLVSNPTFFADAEILAYDPVNTEISHRLVVVSHSANSITVSKKPSTFDFAGSDSKKVGPGYGIILSTIGYGRTSSTVLTGNYVVSRSRLTTDATVGDNQLVFDDTTAMKPEIRVVLGNDDGLRFTTSVVSVSGSTVTIADQIPYDFTVEDNSYSDSYYGLSPTAASDLTADAAEGASSIIVADAGTAAMGDRVDMYDDRGLYERHTVANVVGTAVGLVSTLESEYLVTNGARVVISRPNSTEAHSHTVRAGEFSIVTDADRQLVGDSLYHGHYLSALLEEVLDIRTFGGITYAVGSDSRIFSSADNGETWDVEFDLSSSAEFTPLPSSLTGIFRVSSGELTFAASAGYFVYFSNRYSRYLTG